VNGLTPKKANATKSGKIAKLREALKQIELIELKGEASFSVELLHPVPRWAAKFYLKIARRKKDEQKPSIDNKRARRKSRGSHVAGNRKRDTAKNSTGALRKTENMD
jgi:hypothetical protein